MDKTLAKGLLILEHLVRCDRPCSVSEIAQTFSLVPSNAHRSLKTLVALGYARQTADAKYVPSLRLFELGSQVVDALDIRQVAQQAMARLAESTQETIHLVARDDSQVVYLDKIDSPQPVAAYSKIGGRAPAQCVASGKALLANTLPQSNDLALAWLQKTVPELQAYTRTSHTRHAELLTDLLQVRSQGYAINRGEWREDVCGLGAPIFDGRGQAIGALGISLPTIRSTPERLRELAAQLRAAAASASVLLGHRPGRSIASFESIISSNES